MAERAPHAPLGGPGAACLTRSVSGGGRLRGEHRVGNDGHRALIDPVAGPVDASVSSGQLLVAGSTRGGEAIIENFNEDDYRVQVDVALNSGDDAEIWCRYTDANNGYLLRLEDDGDIELFNVHKGQATCRCFVGGAWSFVRP